MDSLQEARYQLEQACSDEQTPVLDIANKLSDCCDCLARTLGNDVSQADKGEILVALVAIGCGVSAMDRRTKQKQAEVLAVCQHSVWLNGFNCVMLACCFAEKLHFSYTTRNGASAPFSQQIQASARSILKSYLHFLRESLYVDTTDSQALTIFVDLIKMIHKMALTAADFIGWRDTKAIDMPFLRSYGIVNVLWVGLVGAIRSATKALHDRLDASGVGVKLVTSKLISLLVLDTEKMCQNKDVDGVQLLHFWLMQIRGLVSATNDLPGDCSSEVAKEAWHALLQWNFSVWNLQNDTMEDGSRGAKELREAVQKSSLLLRTAVCQVRCLESMGPDASQDAASDLLAKLNHEKDKRRLLSLSLNAVEMLSRASEMCSQSRVAFVPILGASLRSLSSVGPLPASVCKTAADACVTFAMACASKCAEENSKHMDKETWDQCQISFLELSMCPHPTILAVLTSVWVTLASTAQERAIKSWITALYQLLFVSSAAEACRDFFPSPSLIVSQLLALLSALWAAIPAAKSQDIFCYVLLEGGGAHISGEALRDRCHLAKIAALLRSVTGLENQLFSTDQTIDLLHGLTNGVHTATLTPPHFGNGNGTPPPSSDCVLCGNHGHKESYTTAYSLSMAVLHVAWTLDCIQAAIECMGAGHSGQSGAREIQAISAAVNEVTGLLLTRKTKTTAGPPPSLINPALGVLNAAFRACPESLTPGHLEALLPSLHDYLLNNPDTAAQIAALAPAYSCCVRIPQELFSTLLSPPCVCPIYLSPTLRVLGVEGYVGYLGCCEEGAALGVLPNALKDPNSSDITESFKRKLQMHLNRTLTTEGARAAAKLEPAWATAADGYATTELCRLCSFIGEATAATPNTSVIDPVSEIRYFEQIMVDDGRALSAAIEKIASGAGSLYSLKTGAPILQINRGDMDKLRRTRDILSEILSV